MKKTIKKSLFLFDRRTPREPPQPPVDMMGDLENVILISTKNNAPSFVIPKKDWIDIERKLMPYRHKVKLEKYLPPLM
jgi:hypothetical protein